ncbi:AMP-binding protein [Vibrio diazotrophicus]|uniref:AMP-binding protein n=1 Tax=Vibrio diazotrophicus TaxID=685 RepID=UPI00158B7691|nr:AMP-binding protein [Vibrio diazotrophicus]
MIIESLIRHSIETPNKIAFIGGNEEISYQNLLIRVRGLAEYLVEHSPKCIALRAENSLDWVIADLAALYADIPNVPVPLFFTPEQVEHIVTESGADLLLGNWDAWIQNTSADVNSLDAKMVGEAENLSVWKRIVESEKPLLPHTGKITFTSGSTGHPKGVCLSQNQLSKVSRSLADTIATEAKCEKHLVLLPLSTLLENITGIYVPIILGATSVVLNGAEVGLNGSSNFDPSQFALALAKYLPNSLVLTPALLMALIEVVKAMPILARNLEFVAVGGARVSPQLLEMAHSLGIPAFEGYGLSENASVVSLNTPSAYKAGTSGKPLPHIDVKVSNDGEIYVSGCVALGYIDQPFEQGWYATGDLGHLDEDGFLVINGRKKNQIITAFGRNISPEWVESEAQAFRALHGMVLVGDGEKSLSAITANSNVEEVTAALKQLNQRLPDYARIRTLITAQGLSSLAGFYTSNGRPIRSKFEQWMLSKTEQNDGRIITPINE